MLPAGVLIGPGRAEDSVATLTRSWSECMNFESSTSQPFQNFGPVEAR